jgi:sRNA-binding regulator protein Hfq
MNNQSNGRIDINNNKIIQMPLFKEIDNGNDNFSNNAVSAIYEINPLQNKYFSKSNIEKVQQLIIRNVYLLSEKKHVIGRQDDNTLKIIMKSIYLQNGKNLNSNIEAQIKNLNNLVLDYCVPNILSNIEMYLVYKHDISNLPVPLEHPKFISDSGTRTNNNLIQ